MEQPDKFSIVLYGTTIDVSTKFLSNIVNIDLFVAGSHEQESLCSSTIINYPPGTISYQENIYWENKDHESNYRDNTWEFFGYENQSKKAQKNIISQPGRVRVITEPCITLKGWYNNLATNTLIPIPKYEISRFDTHQNMWVPKTFNGDQAITEACQDLILCYEKVLEQGIYIQSKSIAIPTLGADVGFPRDKAAPIALNTITHFLMHHPYAYQCIKLWVKNRSEFVAYTTFLTNYWQRPTLLYCTHKDENHFLYGVPGDIIGYILLLIHLEQD